jgi:hypothetical protein
MTTKRPAWKKGRGKLGVMAPLIGSWQATADSPMGRVRCTRTFMPILDGTYVQLTARWEFAKGRAYDEMAVHGVGDDGRVTFWSFTSDGKRAFGTLAEAPDLHPEAIVFEAQVPAGIARMAYWPDDAGGMRWAVEAKNKKGWKRFTEHHYTTAT